MMRFWETVSFDRSLQKEKLHKIYREVIFMKLFCFILSVLLSFCLVSCTSASKTTEQILFEIMEGCRDLPEGVIYKNTASEGDQGYMSPSLSEALYGKNSFEYFKLLEEYSIYLSSFASPYEIAVFKCYSSSDAKKIERLCRERADIVSVALRRTEFYSLCGNIRIVREGDTVIFLMTDTPNRTARLAKGLI